LKLPLPPPQVRRGSAAMDISARKSLENYRDTQILKKIEEFNFIPH
jgi:hypothetical protein